MANLQWFDLYVLKGLMPIAIHKNSKRPVGEKWNQDWSIERWRPFFETDDYNMGIILGDIVDVEGDSPDSCDRLERMIDGVVRPKFNSSKSVHNLFLNHDKNLTRAVIHGIEFRGYLHQSVVPPSTHEDGSLYHWLSGSQWPIPPMPDELKDYYFKNVDQKTTKPAPCKGPRPQKRIKSGFVKTVCKICNGAYFIHEKRLILEVKAFRAYNIPWMCHGCREMDVRGDCRRIRKEMDRIIPYTESKASSLEGIERFLPRR